MTDCLANLNLTERMMTLKLMVLLLLLLLLTRSAEVCKMLSGTVKMLSWKRVATGSKLLLLSVMLLLNSEMKLEEQMARRNCQPVKKMSENYFKCCFLKESADS